MSKKKKKEPEVFTSEKRTSSVWLKVYAEQFGCPPDAPYIIQLAYLKARLPDFRLKDLDFEYHAIVHCRDTYTGGDFWDPAIEKPHAHIYCRSTELEDGTHWRRFTIKHYLTKLGILMREEDINIFQNGTTFPKREKHEDITAIVYHTHETYDAREQDGKILYDRCECYTNIPADKLEEIYEYYFTTHDAGYRNDQRMKEEEKFALEARELGKVFGDLDNWLHSLPYNIRSNERLCRLFWKEYDFGIQEAIEEFDTVANPKCCIYIFGDHNVGKSYNSKQALKSLGCKVFTASGYDSGRFDKLTTSHNAIVFDDSSFPNPLCACDDYPVTFHRRHSGDPCFAGRYMVITYNLPFEKYCENHYHYDPVKVRAFASRLFICHLENGKLVRDYDCTRGNADTVAKRFEMFNAFAKEFEESLATYIPDNNSQVFTPSPNPEAERLAEYRKQWNL